MALALTAPSFEVSASFSSLFLEVGRFSFFVAFERTPEGAPFVELTKGQHGRDWRLGVGPLHLFAAIEPHTDAPSC